MLESILLILLHPTSARVAIHYAKQWKENNHVPISKMVDGEVKDRISELTFEDDLKFSEKSKL